MEMPASPKQNFRSFSSPFSLPKLIGTLVAVFFVGYTVGAYRATSNAIPDKSSDSESQIGKDTNFPDNENLHHIRKHKSPFINNKVKDRENSNPFILSIVVQFNAMEGLTQFKELFAPMAEWVQQNEPGTISYTMASSDKDPLQALVFEQYVDKHAYAEVHKKSEQFLAFKKKLVAMNDKAVEARLGWKMTGQSYQQPVGFI